MRLVGIVRWPDRQGRQTLAVAAVVWVGVLWGQQLGNVWWAGLVLVTGATAIWLRRLFLFGALMLAVVAGGLYSVRVDRTLATSVGTGPARVQGVLAADPVAGAALFRVEASDRGLVPTVLLLRIPHPAEAGERIVVAGTLVDDSGFWRGRAYAGVLNGHRVEHDLGPSSRWFAAAGIIRDRISTVYDQIDHRGAALVRGFLIGDTSQLPPRSLTDLRDSGLSHYVAVSGSNVALFLVLVWVAIGPLAFNVKLRAVLGMAGLVVFTLVTRWEASVLRAAAMAALMLGGRAAGFPLTAWGALGSAATCLLLISPELATSAGFQLSVAATVGVMGGADLFPSIRVAALRRSLAAAVGAQVAVAPVLLVWFGSVPLVSPLANIVAAPLVAASTAVGGVAGLGGSTALGKAAAVLGGIVLDLASVAARGPQLGPVAAVVIGLAVVAPRRSLQVVLGVCVAAGMVLGSVGSRLPLNTVAFLDVGQGDAAIVRAGDGSTMLIDGGPDADVLLDHLDHYGIDRIDLMLLTHPHDDHAVGLVAAADSRPVGTLWHPGFVDGGPTFTVLVEALSRSSTPIRVPAAGDLYMLGDLEIEVLGPLRRYQSPNDQSLVVRISSATISVLLPGDIEMVAQRELGPLAADVLKVPHHGAATSDLGWLAASQSHLSIVSVGSNTFGHPSVDVVDTLLHAGSRVLRTDEHGTVVLRFDAAVDGQLVGLSSGKS